MMMRFKSICTGTAASLSQAERSGRAWHAERETPSVRLAPAVGNLPRIIELPGKTGQAALTVAGSPTQGISLGGVPSPRLGLPGFLCQTIFANGILVVAKSQVVQDGPVRTGRFVWLAQVWLAA